jgi:hypothetical protein
MAPFSLPIASRKAMGFQSLKRAGDYPANEA